MKTTEAKVGKRDVSSSEMYTAKDVAGIEVIVDLVKNTIGFEDVEQHDEGYKGIGLNTAYINPSTSNTMSNSGTKAIQVHIAIPYNLSIDKKRSLNSKVRRVFAAKMLKPVDLEYQVNSFIDAKDTVATPVQLVDNTNENTRPKMYLLVDAGGSLNKGNYNLKPIKGDVDLSNIKVRQADATKVFDQKTEATTAAANFSKVTLSKDFVAAVNRHLIQLYENLTANDSNHRVRVRETDQKEPVSKVLCAIKSHRRHINWDAVKKYFGHDRVCNCKCVANRTMCRACAASDAVISELIFEFDNLAKYMEDHCTEIQTFFWMNPSGGKKLRDSVHSVDQALHNYFKRVKGKCQGRTCKTFSTCIDRRSLVKQKKCPKNYIGGPLIYDLQKLADDILMATKYNICCDNNLIKNEEVMVDSINSCIKLPRSEFYVKTEKKKPVVKNVYSLDNINVNIICSPDESTCAYGTKTSLFTSKPMTSYDYFTNTVPFDYEYDILSHHKLLNLKRLFSRNRNPNKHKTGMFKYYVSKGKTREPVKVYHKRQIESPLISDSSGIFWHDYIHKQDRSVKDSNKAVTKANTDITTSRVTDDSNNFSQQTGVTETLAAKHIVRDTNNTDTIETLSHNIDELFKIFHSLTNLSDVANLSKHSGQDIQEKGKRPPIKKPKNATKIYKALKGKLHFKHKSNATKSKPTSQSTLKSSTEEIIITIPESTTHKTTHTNIKKLTTLSSVNETVTSKTQDTTKVTSDTEAKKALYTSTESPKSVSILDKIKSATLDFIHGKSKGSSDAKKDTRSITTESIINANALSAIDDDNNHVISNATTEVSPTILIINNYYNEDSANYGYEDIIDKEFDEEDSKLKGLLLSILDFETMKLNDELKRFKKDRHFKKNASKSVPNLHTHR
jgi:hypothetical protein